MRGDARRNGLRTPALEAACEGGPILVHAISGLGKSTLAAEHPSAVLDADAFLYTAVAKSFPGLEPRARLRAWRSLCRSRPWMEGGQDLDTWAAVRRRFVAPFIAAMRTGPHKLVVTSLLAPPWTVSAYYGVERGRYLEHLRIAGRDTDNRQSEGMNNRLDGYAPLVRLPPGTFLGQRPEIIEVVGSAR